MVEEVTPAELYRRLENGEEVRVVDIRPAGAFAAGHIPGAINVPMPELPDRIEEVATGDDVVVACPIGESSVQAARLIESFEGVGEDVEVSSLAGGYDEWTYELEDEA